jgi:hypothetical protein
MISLSSMLQLTRVKTSLLIRPHQVKFEIFVNKKLSSHGTKSGKYGYVMNRAVGYEGTVQNCLLG